MGNWGRCHFKDRIEILRDGRPVFLDSMALAGMLPRIWREHCGWGRRDGVGDLCVSRR
jgi:hypothetical protein